MKRILTYIFGLIIMAAPFAPSTAEEESEHFINFTITDCDSRSPIAGVYFDSGINHSGQNISNTEGKINIIIDESPLPSTISYDLYHVDYEPITNETEAPDTEVITCMHKTTQTNITVTASVVDSQDGTPLAGKHISYNGTTQTTDNNGEASITVPKYAVVEVTDPSGDYTENSFLAKTDGEKTTVLLTKVQEAEEVVTTGQNPYEPCSNDAIADGLQKRGRTKCYPKACNEGFLLMNNSKKKVDTSTMQNSDIVDANLQCIPKTNCHNSDEVGVRESEYELDAQTNKYTCKKICFTENGYTLNTTRNKCETENTCTPDASTHPQAATGKYVGEGNNHKCVPSSCNCGYKLEQQNTANARCTEWTNDDKQNQCEIRGATKTYRYCIDGTQYCHAVECDTNAYAHTENTDNASHNLPSADASLTGNKTKPYTCIAHERKCTDEQRTENETNLAHSTKSSPMVPTDGANGVQVCLPTECECGHDLTNAGKKDAKCESWTTLHRTDKPACTKTPEHASDDKYYRKCRNGKEYCHIDECEGEYKPNNRNDACVGRRGECTPTTDASAPAQHHDKIWESKYKTVKGERKCVITKCATGYEPNEDGSDCTPLMVLSKADSEARINDLKGVYDEARDNETSAANKALGAASMAATGAGGMMLAMGLSEQKADKEAEEKMRGYVATFKCNYGNTNVEYGTQPTELPISTELYNLYAEYVTLANDLKLRKEMLGLRAGIESEKILDSATTGLYDDVSSGRSAGMYTSLARAILDPNGADAAAWAEQAKRSKNLIIAGGVTAGVGVVGSIVGNKLINKDKITLSKVKERIKGINARYQDRVLYDSWTNLENQADIQEKKCSEFAGVSEATKDKKVSDGCECENPLFTFNANNGGCHCGLTNHVVKDMSDSNCACAENATRNENVCTCNPNYTYNNEMQECIANDNPAAPGPQTEKLCNEFVGVSAATQNNKVSEGCECENPLFTFSEPGGGCHCGLTNHVVKDMSDSNCACAENATRNGKVCTCATNYRYNSDTKTCDVDERALRTLTLNGSSMFNTNQATLQTERPETLVATSNLINDWLNSNTEAIQYCFQISGHTDRVPTSRPGGNEQLSEDRAKTVAEFLINNATTEQQAILKSHIRIKGFGEEQCTQDGSQETCRKVEIEHTPEACPNDDGWKSLP